MQSLPTLAGRVLGSYRLMSRLGEGGMGVVYLGEHIRLNRMVAIKVLRRELTRGKEVIERFFNEARAVNDIGHPNIVSIIDFVEKFDEDPPIVYMVLELLEGHTLGAHIEQHGAMDPEQTVRLALQVTDALMVVHKAKILHRDLKPENIFLCQDDAGDHSLVKLLDFGVAKDISEIPEDEITEPGMTVGTPEFMAPEQILDRRLDERVDIYVLGMVLYNMLTGSVPFQGESLGQLLKQHLKEDPPPMSVQRAGGEPLPPALEAVVTRCLNKDPDKRFQTARELHEALGRCLPGSALAAEQDKPHQTSGRLLLVVLAGAVIVLATALVLLLIVR